MIRAIVASLLHCLDTQASAAGLVHLDDAVDAAILVAQRREAASKVYIVAEPRAYSSHEIYEIVLRSPGGGRRAGVRPERCSCQPRWLATSASGSHGGGCPSTRSPCPSSPGLLHTAPRRSSASWASGRRRALRPPPPTWLPSAQLRDRSPEGCWLSTQPDQSLTQESRATHGSREPRHCRPCRQARATHRRRGPTTNPSSWTFHAWSL